MKDYIHRVKELGVGKGRGERGIEGCEGLNEKVGIRNFLSIMKNEKEEIWIGKNRAEVYHS